MAGRGTGPDFVEALARGLDVLACFDDRHPRMSLTEIAEATGLARPTARRLLLTLAELGLVRQTDGAFTLTPKVPRLDGSDIVYVARVSVPKIITLRVVIGTRFPALQTSQGKVLLAALDSETLTATLAEPSRSGLLPAAPRDRGDIDDELRTVRARGWALADEELAPGIRSVAVPVRDGEGEVRAAMNVTVHAAETSVTTLVDDHLPRLIRAAGEISADWALWQSRPHAEVAGPRGAVPGGRLTWGASARQIGGQVSV